MINENQIKWAIDPSHSDITFKVRHLMIAHVKGSFNVFDATIYTTGKDFSTAEIDVVINPSSISTGDSKRDEHLKSADFFDTEAFKQITFKSSTMSKLDKEGKGELWGELTMKGITKKIKLMVQFGGIINDPWGNEKAGFTITGTINRSDWGLTWNTALETGGFMVSEEINISCEVELINVSKNDTSMTLEDIAELKAPF